MNLWFLPPLLTAVALLLSGCGPKDAQVPRCRVTGSGVRDTKTWEKLASYTKVEIDSGIDTQIINGWIPNVEINAYGNVMDSLDVQIIGETLRIRLKPGVCNPGASATVIVVGDPLRSLAVNGSSRVTIDYLFGPIVASGGSTVNVTGYVTCGPITSNEQSNITVGKFFSRSIKICPLSGTTSIFSDGGGLVDVKLGRAYRLEVESAAGSSVKLGNLEATSAYITSDGASSVYGMMVKELTLNVLGGSSIFTFVTEAAKGSCSGGGSVTILGNGDTTALLISSGCVLSAPGHSASSGQAVI